jgi:hypothetical protein
VRRPPSHPELGRLEGADERGSAEGGKGQRQMAKEGGKALRLPLREAFSEII